MKKALRLLIFLFLSVTLLSCGRGNTGDSSSGGNGGEFTPEPTPTYDIDALGFPKFVGTNYLDLSNIYRISKFRSSAGHDFPDAFEDNRSMKHYFHPLSDENGDPSMDWTTIEIYAPVDGTVLWMWDEWGDGSGGYQMWIVPDGYPAFHIRIFHVTPEDGITDGSTITEGQLIGHHATIWTWSDIAVSVWAPSEDSEHGYAERLVSIFDIMTDECFAQYAVYPFITDRTSLILTKEERDLYPGFNDFPEPDSWVLINP